MAFLPDNITKKHILDAVKNIERENIQLKPSTRFDVVIDGKPYPPKEVMRYAHELMNGEHIWERSGGEPTNKYLIALGFEIKNKSDSISQNLTGNVWKLGCNWGSNKPSFYEFLKEQEIVIGVDDKKYNVGDLIIIAEGHTVNAIARVNESPISVTTNNELEKPFEELSIDYEDNINYADAEWYVLDNDDKLNYQLQQGIVRVSPNHEVYKQAQQLWNERNRNYWIFQGNPNAFDFDTAIRNNLLEEWTVSAHKDKIKVGDKVILWISGKNSGCYSLAEVTSEPQIITHSKDSHLWKTEDKNQIKAGIRITHNLIDSPLFWSKIKGTKGLENLKVGNQGTNFSATKKEYKTLYDLINDSTKSENTADMPAKNIILYGPPGTGKTYNSIDKAVEIATGKSVLSHAENKKQFDELRKQGQIEFVTFHQNYSYEDFVLGIRPNVEVETNNLSFKKHYGIFYQIADRAKENYLSSLEEKGKLISVQELINDLLEKLRNGEKIDFKTPTNVPFSIKYFTEQSLQLVYSNGSLNNTLSIDTLIDIAEGKRDYTASLRSYYYSLKDYLLSKRLDDKKEKEDLKNYVLVIDEINRANISKVFGELITLLEDDKRLGEENEIKITLTNGEKEFGVPPNLYIIGTMNTADKSIALIDIALRRRFEFIGYYPKYEETENYKGEAIELLKKINEAIFKEKKSADYLIGHAYFMKKQPINAVLQNKVVPLLMEYFSGKTDIVSKIFADTSWSVTYETTNFIWDISPR